jgi:hypothetical protein
MDSILSSDAHGLSKWTSVRDATEYRIDTKTFWTDTLDVNINAVLTAHWHAKKFEQISKQYLLGIKRDFFLDNPMTACIVSRVGLKATTSLRQLLPLELAASIGFDPSVLLQQNTAVSSCS